MRCKVTFLPVGQVVYAVPGATVKGTIDLARFDLDFPCGGRGRCGKCRVHLLEGADQPADSEKEHLAAEEIAQGYRLTYMTRLYRDAVVELPYVKVPEHKILIDAVARDIKLDPHLQKTYLELDPPTLDHYQADWERLLQGITRQGLKPAGALASLALLRSLPKTLRRGKF